MSGFVAVHTGVGNCLDESRYQLVIKEACVRSANVLKNGGTALEAVEAAIIRLENSGNTNAGFGSNLTWDGDVECDASIMDGASLLFGACTNVSTVQNPISLAKIICQRQSKMLHLERIPPMVLAGDGAAKYAQEVGCKIVEKHQMRSKKAKFSYEHSKQKIANFEDANKLQMSSLDTVGAICVDINGNSAAGCSSGGLQLKISGRVGQAASFGAGCWAQDTPDINVATCTTGHGEYLMKTLLAKEIATNLLVSEYASESLHQTFKEKFLESPLLPSNQELYGGALSLIYSPKSSFGELLWCHTTKYFCLGYMCTTDKTPRFVSSSLPNYCIPGKSIVVNGSNFKLS